VRPPAPSGSLREPSRWILAISWPNCLSEAAGTRRSQFHGQAGSFRQQNIRATNSQGRTLLQMVLHNGPVFRCANRPSHQCEASCAACVRVGVIFRRQFAWPRCPLCPHEPTWSVHQGSPKSARNGPSLEKGISVFCLSSNTRKGYIHSIDGAVECWVGLCALWRLQFFTHLF